MSFDVFISYSSKNSVIATAACAAVESAGAHCWMAPRNIRPGRTYGEAIIEGMNECKVLVLIYSTFSNASPQVLREVERAVSKGLEIITVRVDDVVMSKAMEYFLASTHWLDAVNIDTESALARLAEAVKGGLDTEFSPPAPLPNPLVPRLGEGSKPPATPANNLPAAVTSFVGRSTEKAAVGEALVGSRMITITGPGGSGKTRLALEVAAEQLDRFPGGVWFVDLSTLGQGATAVDIASALVSALRLTEVADRDPLQIVVDRLRAASTLLVFDSCEQVADSVRDTSSAILRECAGVKILATGRSAIGAAGESVWPLSPFAAVDLEKLPRGGQALVDAVAANDSVRLFVDRARAVMPAFAVNEHNARAVAEICAAVDGIPLAVELAAARVRVLPPDQIAAKMIDRFRLLAGNKGAPERQQTLRATLDWSYDLLSETERVLLQRLSVFAGPSTMDAVEAICTGDPIDDWDVLDLLTGLVDKSLVLAEEWEGGYRYRLLQSVREYAAEKALTPGPSPEPARSSLERGETERRHRDWYLKAVEEAEPNLWGPFQAAWLDRIDADRPNWLAALAWSVDHGEANEAARIAAAAGRFWLLRGRFAEASIWLERVAALDGVEDAVFAKVLNAAGSIAWSRGDIETARAHFDRGLALYRHLGDTQRTADLLNNLGNIALDSDDAERAQSLLEEALASYRSLGDQPGISAATGNLALIVLRAGDFDRARDLYEQSLAVDRELDDSWAIATSLHGLGLIDCRTGHLAEARTHLVDSLDRRVAIDDQNGIAECLEGLGELALAQDDAERALRLWAAAAAIRQSAGAALPEADRVALDARIVDATDRVGAVVKAKAWDEGSTWSSEESVRQARLD